MVEIAILIVSKTSYAKSPFDAWLHDLHEDLVMLTTPKVASACSNYQHVETFDHYETNGWLEVRALELNEQFRFRAIVAPSEYDMLRVGRLRDQLGIEGQSLDSATAFRNKIVMKQRVAAAGLPIPTFTEIASPLDLYQFVQEHGYPVVVKPISGMGSTDTALLHDREELKAYLEQGLAPDLEVERFVPGEMYHVDGLVLNGELVHCWPSRYTNGCLAFQDGKLNGSYLLGKENPLTDRLVAFVTEVLAALPTPATTSFHAEVFHTPEDELVFCEIASRTGGGPIREMVRQGFGIDLTQAWVQAQAGLPVTLPRASLGEGPQRPSGFLLIPARHGVLRKMPTEPYADWVTKQVISARPGQAFTGSVSSVDAIASFLVDGESADQVANRIEELASWYEQAVEWEKASA